ncbi:MAG: hypothetical protein ACREP7_05470 [Lysobacter sp.]
MLRKFPMADTYREGDAWVVRSLSAGFKHRGEATELGRGETEAIAWATADANCTAAAFALRTATGGAQ